MIQLKNEPTRGKRGGDIRIMTRNTAQNPISTLGRVDGYQAVGMFGNDLDDYYVKLFYKLFKIKGSEEMEFTFMIYPNNIDGHARTLTATQTAIDLDDAIDEATKILKVFKKSAEVVFTISYDGKDVAGICPDVEDWVKF